MNCNHETKKEMRAHEKLVGRNCSGKYKNQTEVRVHKYMPTPTAKCSCGNDRANGSSRCTKCLGNYKVQKSETRIREATIKQ